MKNLRMKAMTLVLGLGVVGCGGTEEPTFQEKSDASKPTRARLLKEPWLNDWANGTEERSALATDAYYHEVAYVCGTTVDNLTGCEDVQGWDDTYFNFNGTVQVYTYERYGDGSYFASFAGSAVYTDEIVSEWPNGVLRVRRRYTLPNVTSGTFFSQIQRVNSTSYYSDTVYIK